MSVTVTPEEFSLVNFDAAEIKAVVEKLIPAIGLPADLDVHDRGRRGDPARAGRRSRRTTIRS